MTENRSFHSAGDIDPLLPATDAPSAAIGADGSPENEPMTETKYEYHECAGIFPMMDEASLAELTARIKESGLREPIVLHEGRILDGRNRYQACLAAGVTPRFETLPEGVDPLEYVFDLNFTRRHLSDTQREAAAVDYPNMKQGRNPKIANGPNAPFTPHSQAEAAGKFKVSHRNVKRAAAAKKADPKLFEDMKADKITTGGATRQIKDKQSSSSKPKADKPLPKGEKLTEEERRSRVLLRLLSAWKPVPSAWNEACCLPAQCEFIKKIADDLAVKIEFANIVADGRAKSFPPIGGDKPKEKTPKANKAEEEGEAPRQQPLPGDEELHDCGRQIGAVGHSAPRTEAESGINVPSELDAPNEPTIAEPVYFPGLQRAKCRKLGPRQEAWLRPSKPGQREEEKRRLQP